MLSKNVFLLSFQVIDELKDKVKDLKENELWTCILFDEMSIKQDLVIFTILVLK